MVILISPAPILPEDWCHVEGAYFLNKENTVQLLIILFLYKSWTLGSEVIWWWLIINCRKFGFDGADSFWVFRHSGLLLQ